MDDRAQAIILFSLVISTVILTLGYLHAMNMISGVESSRAMLAYPKEEIRNLREVKKDAGMYISDVNDQVQVLCARKGWICNIAINRIEFKNVEVDYCEGSCS